MQDNDETWDDICPNCGVGHVAMSSKPYVKLFHKHLFTIPDAVGYQCDICNYYEFDESTFEVINDMMFGATTQSNGEGRTRPLPPMTDEDLPQQGKPSSF